MRSLFVVIFLMVNEFRCEVIVRCFFQWSMSLLGVRSLFVDFFNGQ